MIPVFRLAKVKITGDTLTKGMFKDSPEKVTKVAEGRTNVATQKEYARHIHAQDLKNMGLVIKDLCVNFGRAGLPLVVGVD